MLSKENLMLSVLICFFSRDGVSQLSPSKMNNYPIKPFITSLTYTQWPSVTQGCISNNGSFVSYIIENRPIGSQTGVIVSGKNSRKLLIPNISSPIAFTSNSQFALWINKGDSLGIIKLDNSRVSYTPYVVSYEIKGNFIIYKLKNSLNTIVIKNAKTNKANLYTSVSSYKVSENNRSIVLLQTIKNNKELVQELNVVDLKNDKLLTVWRGTKVKNFILDRYGEKLALITEGKASGVSTIWYTEISSISTAQCLATEESSAINPNLKFGDLQRFSKDGDLIFITLIVKERNLTLPLAQNIAKVDIWSFNDPKLQSYQLYDQQYDSYTAVIRLSNSKITQLEHANEWMISPLPNPIEAVDSLALIRAQENDGKGGEGNWNRTCKVDWYIVSTLTGYRTPLNFINGSVQVDLSPGRKYIVYYDSKEKDYFSYEIATKKIKNITKGVHEIWENYTNDECYRYRSIGGWEEKDAKLIIYGKQDIWQIDPSGVVSPVCLTNRYGYLHHIVFSLALDEYNRRCVRKGEVLILTAFNQKTKENGFYQKKMDTRGDPDSLTMESRIYDTMNNQSIQSAYNFSPQRAQHARTYILKRMSAREAPNYFSTTDFKSFKALSDLYPEKMYNWYTSELHTWKTSSQTFLQGILYKPENFDSSKKYPVIFHYYEKKSDGLNAYLIPEALSGSCNINIPYYTSNGYLVFCPDIRYTIGDPMQGAFESITSAALYLSQLPFVNANRMGLQGCSWGGIQTNYLVTKTNLFAAACSSSGMADWISGYGSILSYGASLQGMYELGQFRMNGTLWEKTFYYIKNSPVLFTDKISTPILIMHTKNDGICPLSNILEFFTALRRLGKVSWMLIYKGDHGLYGKEAEDFSARMKHFFDYYLMDSLPPNWMTASIHEDRQRSKSRLEFDARIKCSDSNLVKNHKWRKIDY